MLKATVILIVLIVSTSIHAQPTSAWSQPGAYQVPQSTWNDDYQPPKSQWSSPKTYRASKSTWSTNGSRQPAKRQAPQSWWTDPGQFLLFQLKAAATTSVRLISLARACRELA